MALFHKPTATQHYLTCYTTSKSLYHKPHLFNNCAFSRLTST